MTSYRTQINEAIQAQLVGKTVAGQAVHIALDRPLQPSDMPAVIVYTLAARREPQDYGDALIKRRVTVSIEAAVVALPSEAQAVAEALADQIETAIEADPTLGNTVVDTEWQQSVSDVVSAGETTFGVCLLEYDVVIMTNQKPEGFYELNDDKLDGLPTKVSSDPRVKFPDFDAGFTVKDGSVCGPNGCDVPAWNGDGDQ